MRPTTLDSAAKESLRKTIRALRGTLIDELGEAAKGEYRLDVTLEKAKLPEARHCRRKRLEDWLDEQARGTGKATGKGKAAAEVRQRYLGEAVKEAAHTLVNRLVMLRILEHHGVMAPAVVTGGMRSPGYEKEFLGYAGPLASDETRGYRPRLRWIPGARRSSSRG